MILKNKRAAVFLITFVPTRICWDFIVPLLSIALTSPPHNMTVAHAGLGFTLNYFCFGVASPLLGLLCKYMDRRAIISTSILAIAVTLFIVGPSKLFFPHEQTFLMFVGLGFMGVGEAGVFVPTIPELIESV
jgi:MFS family permease